MSFASIVNEIDRRIPRALQADGRISNLKRAEQAGLSRAGVEAGEEIVLARGKVPIAKLVPYQAATPKRQFGALRGVISIGPEFFEPLSGR